MRLDIHHKSIKALLDNLDLILNSNTFLLFTKLEYKNLEKLVEELTSFIKSPDFIQQILTQDELRGWHNFDRFRTLETNKIKFIKDNFILLPTVMEEENQIPYLRNMLTIENRNDVFFSPYRTPLSLDFAEDLVLDFLNAVTNNQEWKLIKFNTDFCYPRSIQTPESTEMHYFEDGYSSDSMTLLVNESKEGFLLLTNGIA